LNINLPSTSRSSKWFFPWGISLLLHACHMPRPSHSPWFNCPNIIWRRVQIMKLLIQPFSPASCYFRHLRSNFFLSILLTNTLSLCASINVYDQEVPDPHRTTGNLYFCTHWFLCVWRGTRRQKILKHSRI
jgi:hypothetical protein